MIGFTMKILMLFVFLCMSTIGCKSREDFVAHVQFEISMKKSDWTEFIHHLQTVVPKEKYTGRNIEIKSTVGAPDLLFLIAESNDGMLKVLVAQRENKESLSVILYSGQSCNKCESYAVESVRIEKELRKYYGSKLLKNTGDFKIPF